MVIIDSRCKKIFTVIPYINIKSKYNDSVKKIAINQTMIVSAADAALAVAYSPAQKINFYCKHIKNQGILY
jgi:uncharacterized protein YccT (UPF0319 family)